MTAGYLVTWLTTDGAPGHYLEWIPPLKAYEFLAAEPQYATVFSFDEATYRARQERLQGRNAVVIADVRGREVPARVTQGDAA